MARKETKYTVNAYIRVKSIPENLNGKTYSERIAPQMIPIDEYFDNEKFGNVSRREWVRRHEEAALSAVFGVPVTVTN